MHLKTRSDQCDIRTVTIFIPRIRLRVMLRSQRNKLAVLILIAAWIIVLVIVRSSKRWSLLSTVGSASNVTCNYVCFSVPKTGNRLGNHLFYYTGVQYVAWLTGRTPCIRSASLKTPLDRVFDVDVARLGSKGRCPVYRFTYMQKCLLRFLLCHILRFRQRFYRNICNADAV